MQNFTKRQKELLIDLLNQRIAAVYEPKGAITVDGQMLKRINEQLKYRQELIEIRKLIT